MVEFETYLGSRSKLLRREVSSQSSRWCLPITQVDIDCEAFIDVSLRLLASGQYEEARRALRLATLSNECDDLRLVHAPSLLWHLWAGGILPVYGRGFLSNSKKSVSVSGSTVRKDERSVEDEVPKVWK